MVMVVTAALMGGTEVTLALTEVTQRTEVTDTVALSSANRRSDDRPTSSPIETYLTLT